MMVDPRLKSDLSIAVGLDDRQLRMLLSSVKDYAIYMIDLNGMVSSWNTGAQLCNGYTAGEIIGKHFSCFYTELDRAEGTPRHALATAFKVGKFETESWQVRKDGTVFWSSIVIEPALDETATLIGYAKVTRDITAKRDADLALRESERHFEMFVSGVNDYAIYMLDCDGRVTSWNAGAHMIKGYEAEEIIGQHFSCFYTDEDRAAGEPERALMTALGKGKFKAEGWRVRKDGTRFWAHVMIDPIHDEFGEMIGYAKVTRDITDRRKAQAVEWSRLSAMGTMASTLAHELNQPLSAITNYVRGSRILLERGSPHADAIKALIGAEKSAVRCGEIIERARALVSYGNPRQSPQDVRSLVEEALNLAVDENLWHGIDRVIKFDPTVLIVRADRVQIEQVLINLVRNAIEAMADRPRRKLVVETRRRGQDHCEILVRDTGSGVPEGTADRLFDPFNSTKNSGMGIGLSICRTIIESHGGHIWSRTDPGHGTAFSFTLPCNINEQTAEFNGQ